MSAVLVLGGVRSGKSRLAERTAAGFGHVTYVAPGPVPDVRDPEWAARVDAHRRRRPSGWITVETGDVPGAITSAAGAGCHDAGGAEPRLVLVDCLGTWVTRLIDDAGAWDDPSAAEEVMATATAGLVSAVHRTLDSSLTVILVSNETGLGVVPEHASGRLFRDALGRLNQAMADECDRVVLVVAGRVLDLSASPRVDELAAVWPRRPE